MRKQIGDGDYISAGELASKNARKFILTIMPMAVSRSGSQPLRGEDVGSDASFESQNFSGAVAAAHVQWILCTSFNSVWSATTDVLMSTILLACLSGARAWMWCVLTAVMGIALAGWRVRKDRGGRQPSSTTASATRHNKGPTKPARAAPAMQNRRTLHAERKEAKKPDGAPEKENAGDGAQRQGDAKRGRGQRSPSSRSAQKREECGRGSDTDGMCGGRSEGSWTPT